jgi:hypothetical protein
MKSKYVITDNGPVVFSEMMQHADVARALGSEVYGAGFCYIDDNRYVCYGESISLKMKADPEKDSAKLNRLLGVDY